jgi:hypothetical protein
MNSGKQISIGWYVITDYFMAVLAWTIFYLIRKWLIKEPIPDAGQLLTDNMLWLGVIIIPMAWLILFALV